MHCLRRLLGVVNALLEVGTVTGTVNALLHAGTWCCECSAGGGYLVQVFPA